jgi:signal peptide peptidase SppA
LKKKLSSKNNTLKVLGSNQPVLMNPEFIQSFISQSEQGIDASNKADRPKISATTTYNISGQESPESNTKTVATIPIHGPIEHRQSLMGWWFDYPNVLDIKKQFDAYLADSSIDAIVFDIDSPGGEVSGTLNLAKHIYENRDKKPVIALANEHMFSAAYWIGSACEKMYITSPTAQVGSIGVIMMLYNYANPDLWGTKYTLVYAGKEKANGHPFNELSKDAVKKFQSKIDSIYDMFVSDVAKHRGVDNKTVLKNTAEGKTFLGSEAIENGLVDGIATIEEAISEIFKDKNNNEENDMTAMQLVKALFDVDAKDEAAAIALLSEKFSAQIKTINSLEKAKTDLSSELSELKESIVSMDAINEAIDKKFAAEKDSLNDPEALVQNALAQGKILKADVPNQIKLATADYVGTKAALEKIEIGSAIEKVEKPKSKSEEIDKPKSNRERLKALI